MKSADYPKNTSVIRGNENYGMIITSVSCNFSNVIKESNSIISTPNYDGRNSYQQSFHFTPVISTHLKFKSHYLLNDERKITAFVVKHELNDFLIWLCSPIAEIFGDIERKLHLFQSWDEESPHLVLTICSSLEDLDEMMTLEDKLFEKIKEYSMTHNELHHIVITQD